MQERAAADLAAGVTKALGETNLTFDGHACFATPRRLALLVDGLADHQPDVDVERRGPRVGAPQKAIDGFLRSLGTDDYSLAEQDDKKGKVLIARFVRRGAGDT